MPLFSLSKCDDTVARHPVVISARRSLESVSFVGCADFLVSHVTCDSRACRPGSLFAVLAGSKTHGRRYISDALRNGASGLLVERPLARVDVQQVVVVDPRRAYAQLIQALHGSPARQLGVVGITGTNGKTTTSWMVRAILRSAQRTCGLLGTIEYDDGINVRPSDLTTPDPTTLAEWLSNMRQRGTRHVVMELSSHALDQSRAAGVDLDVAVITNITHDHLDYHGDFERYRRAKSRILSKVKPGGLVVVNLDDPMSSNLLSLLPDQTQALTFSIEQSADLSATILSSGSEGSSFRVRCGVEEVECRTSLAGRHNVANGLAAIAACMHFGLSLETCCAGLQELVTVPGRLQRINPGDPFTVFVDYAHTPDAIERAVSTIKSMTAGRVFCVFGAGGDRDRSKRPKMALAASAADVIVLTSDNPRSEDPLAILADLARGLPTDVEVHREPDRRRALEWAIQQAAEGDAILVAGKGHETYQVVGRERFPFDDAQVCRELLAARSGGRPRRRSKVEREAPARASQVSQNSSLMSGPHFVPGIHSTAASAIEEPVHPAGLET